MNVALHRDRDFLILPTGLDRWSTWRLRLVPSDVAAAWRRQNAKTALRKLEDGQTSADHHEGWRYFCEKTDLKAGMNPAEATKLRQTGLEIRESKALH
jgi:hypothetical protein